MLGVFLLPYPIRGYLAPHLFIYYRFLTSLSEPAVFFVSDDYLTAPETWSKQTRWELEEHNQCRLGYAVPTREVMQSHHYRFFDRSLFRTLLDTSGGNPVAVFRRLLLDRIPQLEERFSKWLDEFAEGEIEALATWSNCPSLNAAARSRGIPVVNLELGPLRWPAYRQTAYLDFKGVNGNTEAEERYLASSFSFDGSRDELRRFFILEEDRPRGLRKDAIGLALQVEDDSNLIAFGNGFDNQSLIAYAQLHFAAGKLLARPHPGSLFDLKESGVKVDRSSSSIDFIMKCEQVVTVNSSVGLEAILQGAPVTVLGDCSYAYISHAESEREIVSRLAYYLFAYLVPMDLIYDVSYLRWRLGGPSEAALVSRHFAEYLGPGIDSNCFEGCSASDAVTKAVRLVGEPGR
jgi:hypothetical protein